MIVYFYDLKPKLKSEYNRIKRVFYYNLNKIKLPEFSYKTKSVLIIHEKHEKLLDSFFISFKDNIEVYKIKTEKINQIL